MVVGKKGGKKGDRGKKGDIAILFGTRCALGQPPLIQGFFRIWSLFFTFGTKVEPSKKTEPVVSRKAEPCGPSGVVGSEGRARVAQLDTRVSARSEVGPGVAA